MTIKEEKKETISDKINKELNNPSPFLNISMDMSEIAVDLLFEDGGIMEKVPVVKSFHAFYKAGVNIRDKHFVKKLILFLQEFHKGTIDDKKLNKFKQKMNDDEKYRQKVMDNIIIFCERFSTEEKSKILARLFKNHINGKYDFQTYRHFAVCLDSIHPLGIEFLKEMAGNDFQNSSRDNQDKEAWLYSCGIGYNTRGFDSTFEVSKLGQDLYHYGVKED